MSSYIVEPETIDRIVTWIWGDHESDWLKRALVKLGYDLYSEIGPDELGRAMYRLNVRAVNACYSERDIESYAGYDKHHIVPANRTQVYKSLSCWLYQCSEGDIPQTELFRFMEGEAKPMLADIVISGLPAYNAAKWG